MSRTNRDITYAHWNARGFSKSPVTQAQKYVEELEESGYGVTPSLRDRRLANEANTKTWDDKGCSAAQEYSWALPQVWALMEGEDFSFSEALRVVINL